jgi:hypothetical protein
MQFPTALAAGDIPLIPIVVIVSVFTFTGVIVSIAIWTDARRKEREQLYRSELLKKLAEGPGAAAEQVLAVLREEDARKQRRVRDGLMLAGLILVMLAVGAVIAGITAVVHGSDHPREESLWVLGLIPLMIGIALLIHAKFVVRTPRT